MKKINLGIALGLVSGVASVQATPNIPASSQIQQISSSNIVTPAVNQNYILLAQGQGGNGGNAGKGGNAGSGGKGDDGGAGGKGSQKPLRK